MDAIVYRFAMASAASKLDPTQPARRAAMRREIARPPEVDAEIAVALATPATEWQANAGSWKPETLVHLTKHLKRPEDSHLLGTLLQDFVFPAAFAIVMSNSRGLRDADRDDVVRSIYERILKTVMNGSPALPDFLEARFGLKVKQWTIDVVRAKVREPETVVYADEHQKAHELGAWEDEQRHELVRAFEGRLKNLVAKVLATCPRWVQQAFVQHVMDGIPIESDNAQTLTVAKIHDKSGRAVRMWFAKIREQVKTELRRDDNEHQ